ncbi:hypothetical protein JOB18_008140 [Solea senegalensis]|uniref:Uncharacterized protein n=1 Tax=Solea senegalensis TaxID=28829 RepID=A0AAV6S4J5_SOLSE|nr:hypothetical protein JOB18_008140 [Solea senegalensis]
MELQWPPTEADREVLVLLVVGFLVDRSKILSTSGERRDAAAGEGAQEAGQICWAASGRRTIRQGEREKHGSQRLVDQLVLQPLLMSAAENKPERLTSSL